MMIASNLQEHASYLTQYATSALEYTQHAQALARHLDRGLTCFNSAREQPGSPNSEPSFGEKTDMLCICVSAFTWPGNATYCIGRERRLSAWPEARAGLYTFTCRCPGDKIRSMNLLIGYTYFSRLDSSTSSTNGPGPDRHPRRGCSAAAADRLEVCRRT